MNPKASKIILGSILGLIILLGSPIEALAKGEAAAKIDRLYLKINLIEAHLIVFASYFIKPAPAATESPSTRPAVYLSLPIPAEVLYTTVDPADHQIKDNILIYKGKIEAGGTEIPVHLDTPYTKGKGRFKISSASAIKRVELELTTLRPEILAGLTLRINGQPLEPEPGKEGVRLYYYQNSASALSVEITGIPAPESIRLHVFLGIGISLLLIGLCLAVFVKKVPWLLSDKKTLQSLFDRICQVLAQDLEGGKLLDPKVVGEFHQLKDFLKARLKEDR